MIHMRDLSTRLEHTLHLSKPVEVYEPPLAAAEDRLPMTWQFLERHRRTPNQGEADQADGDPNYGRPYDYYWTNNPESL